MVWICRCCRPRDAKVDQLDTSVIRKEDVRRFNISMCNTNGMKVGKSRDDLIRDGFGHDIKSALEFFAMRVPLVEKRMRRKRRGGKKVGQRMRNIWHPKHERLGSRVSLVAQNIDDLEQQHVGKWTTKVRNCTKRLHERRSREFEALSRYHEVLWRVYNEQVQF